MAVIKQIHAESEATVTGKPVLEDLDAKLQQMVGVAQQTAESIIEAARIEAERLGAVAREQGHAEGLEAGRAEGRAAAMQETSERVEQTCGAWTAMLEQWESDRTRQLRQTEEDFIGTAIQLAESIVHRSIAVDPMAVRGSLQSALELVRRPTDVVVRVHPDDEGFVAEILDEVVSSMSSCTSARVQSDDGIEQGGCRLDLDGGSIDATLATQFERIAAVLLPVPEAEAS